MLVIFSIQVLSLIIFNSLENLKAYCGVLFLDLYLLKGKITRPQVPCQVQHSPAQHLDYRTKLLAELTLIVFPCQFSANKELYFALLGANSYEMAKSLEISGHYYEIGAPFKALQFSKQSRLGHGSWHFLGPMGWPFNCL